MILATIVATPLFFAAQDWPHMRGPAGDGRAELDESLAAKELDLRLAWTMPLGPSYSCVAVGDGVVVSMLSDGEVDAVGAFDEQSGEAQWRHDLGPVYLGHDGSEDGVVSSPAIGAGAVYALDSHGKLVALELQGGELRWTLDLVADLGAEVPDYGFGTSPLYESDLVILQAGGSEGRNLVALDPALGEVVWSQAVGGGAGYSTPVAMDLAGRRQLVVLGGTEISGVVPDTGEVLWTHPLGERQSARSGVATAIDGDRFCAYVSGQLAAFGVSNTGQSYRVEPLFSSRELGGTYAAPVAYDGHLYGFRSDFLSCIDAGTGKRVWKSRPPGGRGLILVGDKLVVFGAQGVVALAKATPEGYQEEARVQALEHSGFAWPSYADGRVFVRNSGELACIELVERGASPIAAGATREPGDHPFGRFVRSVEGAEDKGALIDAFFAESGELPIVEDGLVHFVYRGEAEDVAIAGSMIDGARPEPLRRIEGTDIFYRSFELDPGTRVEYRYQVDLGDFVTDPANPLTAPADRGDEGVSVVALPGYEMPTHLEPSEASDAGTIETYEFTSEQLENKREVRVWLPPGYADGEASYPVLLVHQGSDWFEKGGLVAALENLVGDSVAPLIAVGIEPVPQWWHEAGGTGTREYLDMLATEFLPDLQERYRVSADPADRALMGSLGFGLTAAYGALLHSDAFGKAAVPTAALDDVTRHEFFELLESESERDVVFHVDWNRYEDRDTDRGYDYGADSKRLFEALRARGYEVTGGEVLDGHGWGSRRARTDDFLVALFPSN